MVDLATHERRLWGDAYRPARCDRCGAAVHVHERRARLLRGESEGSTEIAIYRCADRERCGAVWRVLPALLARHLWRAWSTVERAMGEPREHEAPAAGNVDVPARTRVRWRERLASSAALVVAVLTTAMDVPRLATVVTRAGYAATRAAVVAVFAEEREPPARGPALAELASVVHRLAPGVRLM